MPNELRFPSKLVFKLNRRRYMRAQTERYYIIRPSGRQSTLLLLGSSANEYTITFTRTSISCNCRDNHKFCKHIHFILHITGFIKNSDDGFITFDASSVLPLLWQRPSTAPVNAALLDTHTNALCYRDHYTPCLWCPYRPNHGGGCIIICSKCGYIGHKHCFHSSYRDRPRSDLPQRGSPCPRCNRDFFALESTLDAHGIPNDGFRNYYNILHHFDYIVSSATPSYQNGAACRVVSEPPPRPLPDVPQPLPDSLPSNHLIPSSPGSFVEGSRDI